ncbi:hypothetical protein KUA24_149 [Vibrio phage HNL01]|nr:hypothetical protein KUA24_149 [Vibrio phage HNL01]
MHKVIVGSPPIRYSRENLEYSAKELGLSLNFIEELSDSELHDVVLNESCRQMQKKGE